MAKGKSRRFTKSSAKYSSLQSANYPISEDFDATETYDPIKPRSIDKHYVIGSDPTSMDSEPEEQIANTWPAFTVKGLAGEIRIAPGTAFLVVVIAWAVTCSWLFLADNQLGKLDSVNGLIWLGTKAAFMTAFYLIIMFILVVYALVVRRGFKPRGKFT